MILKCCCFITFYLFKPSVFYFFKMHGWPVQYIFNIFDCFWFKCLCIQFFLILFMKIMIVFKIMTISQYKLITRKPLYILISYIKTESFSWFRNDLNLIIFNKWKHNKKIFMKIFKSKPKMFKYVFFEW